MEIPEHKDNPEEKKDIPVESVGINKDNVSSEKEAIKTELQNNVAKIDQNTTQDIGAEISKGIVNETESDRIIARWTRNLGIYTLVLSCCAVAGIIFTIIQIYYSNKTTDESFVKMQSALNAFKTIARADSVSAENTKISLAITQKSFLDENRAFIAIDNFPPYNVRCINGTFAVIVKNTGKTPAYIGFATLIKFISDSEFTKMRIDTASLSKKAFKRGQSIYLGGGGTYTLKSIPVYIGAPEYGDDLEERLEGNKLFKYIWMDIIYRDFFGKQHFTHFCGKLDWKDDTFTPLGTYNDAD